MNKIEEIIELDEKIVQEFDILDVLGRGAYGVVWKVKRKSTGEIFALKKIFQAFQNQRDAQRAYREALGLKQLDHPNVVRLLEIMPVNYFDLYLLFEYMDADLSKVNEKRILKYLHQLQQNKQPIKLDEIVQITQGICHALEYVHARKFIHRDLKPANILMNNIHEVKVCDFALGGYDVYPIQGNMTDYIGTRWYRAPEMVLRNQRYTSAVDIWALGCVVAELFLGGPILQGQSAIDQVLKIFQLLGKPKPDDIKDLKCKLPVQIIQTFSTTKVIDQLIKHIPNDAQDFIKKCLQYSPLKRPTIDQLLQHSFLTLQNRHSHQFHAQLPILYGLEDNKRYPIKHYKEQLTSHSTRKFNVKSKRIIPTRTSETKMLFSQHDTAEKQILTQTQLTANNGPRGPHIQDTKIPIINKITYHRINSLDWQFDDILIANAFNDFPKPEDEDTQSIRLPYSKHTKSVHQKPDIQKIRIKRVNSQHSISIGSPATKIPGISSPGRAETYYNSNMPSQHKLQTLLRKTQTASKPLR